MTRIIRYTISGFLGAVLGWALMEWTPLMPDIETGVPYAFLFVIGLVSGMLIGLLLGIAEGVSGLSPRDAGRSVLWGALVGAAGGVVGITFGQAIYSVFRGMVALGPALPPNIPVEARPVGSATGLLAFLLLLVGRGSGWAMIGGCIGMSQGLATSSTKRMMNGAVGGFIGGGLGGSVFEMLAWMNRGGVANFPPEMVRFISFGITGAAIGLFIGLVEEIAKQAWLLRLIGRNEGREYTIFKPVTVIGRSEFADVAVFDDPDVAPEHARITAENRRHTVQDMGSTFGTRVNGVVITQPQILTDGDEIIVGKTRFLFRDKASARSSTAALGYAVPTQIPSSGEQVCPFCGETKDSSGKCRCTPGVSRPRTVQRDYQQPAQQSVTVPAGVAPDQTGSAASGPRLVCVAGPYQGQSYVLSSADNRIGRDTARDIALTADNTVSREHAKIVQEGCVWVVYDVGSTNGTYVNNQRITRQPLANGDLVQIGSSRFSFEG